MLIGVSAPFTAQLWNETADTWVVSWVPEDLAATSVPVAGTSGTQSAQFTVEGRHVAVLTVTLPSCVDAFQAPVQSGGTITWSLSSGGEELASETVSCADADGYAFAVEVHAAPSLGEVEAASREDAEEAALLKAADEALSMAKAFASFNSAKARLSSAPPVVDTFSTPFKIDPFKIPAEEKIGLLIEVTSQALKKKDIAVSEAFMEFSRVEKEFYSSEGSKILQTILTSGGGYHVIAENGREVQRRSFPDAHHGLFSTIGYELFEELGMASTVERVAEEARALLKAKECPTEKTDIIIDGSQMALQLHESCGHPVELDRVLGTETGLAGGSFLTLDKRGSFRYGSKHVSIYADPTHTGGAGSYKYDDEGVRARRVDLVKDGVFTGYLTSRESASKACFASTTLWLSA